MNIIIKELAQQQAGSILMDLVMPDSGRPERVEWNIGCTTEHLEQFAEQIIKECTEVCRQQIEEYKKDMKSAYDREEKEICYEAIACADRIRYKINRMFGLK